MAQQHNVGSHATTVRRDKAGVLSVVYHQTEVVRADANTITLDTGGYFTSTTKTRMNQAARQSTRSATPSTRRPGSGTPSTTASIIRSSVTPLR
jgi:hypothetical protein